MFWRGMCVRRPTKCEGRGALGLGRAVPQFCRRATQSFSGVLSHSQSIARLPVVPCRLAVLSSRGPAVPDSVWVGKNLPAKRESDPQGGRNEVLLERNVREKTRKVRGRRGTWGGALRSSDIPSSRCLVGALLSRSQSFSGVLSHSQSSRGPVVPWSRRPVVPWSRSSR